MNLEQMINKIDNLKEFYSIELSEDQLAAQKETITYVNGYLRELGINPAKIDPFTFFKSGSTGKLYTRKDTIRKAINDNFEKLMEASSGEEYKIDSKVREIFIAKAGSIADNKARKIRDKKESIRRAEGRIRDYTSEINNHIRNIGQYREDIIQLEQLPSAAEAYVAKIEKVLAQTDFFTLKPESLRNGELVFITKDVYIEHPRPSSDNKMNLGKFELVINMNNGGRMHARPTECNKVIPRGINPHPHVSDSGSICWGNMADRISRFVKESETDKIMLVFEQLLTTYHPHNPYISAGELEKYVFDFKDCPSCGQQREIDILGGRTTCRSCGFDAKPINESIIKMTNKDGLEAIVVYSKMGSDQEYQIHTPDGKIAETGLSITNVINMLYEAVSVETLSPNIKDLSSAGKELVNTCSYEFNGEIITLTHATANVFNIPLHKESTPMVLNVNDVDETLFESKRGLKYKLIPGPIKDLRRIRLMYLDPGAMTDFDGFVEFTDLRWRKTVASHYIPSKENKSIFTLTKKES